MKGIGEVFELPLIAIDEGVECGKVKELLVSSEEGRVEYLIIDDGQWYLGAKLLPFDKVIGMGVDAVTTDTRSNIKGFGEEEKAIELAGKKIRILGAGCYTQKGKYIGAVKEYYINEEDGTIIGCEIDTHEVRKIIPTSSILTFGKDVLVVIENVEETMVCGFQEENCEIPISHAEDGHEIGFADAEDHIQDKEKFNVFGGRNASKLFEQRQVQFLLGRKVNKRIVDEHGEILIDKYQLVTEDIIDRIKACGKLVELIMSAR